MVREFSSVSRISGLAPGNKTFQEVLTSRIWQMLRAKLNLWTRMKNIFLWRERALGALKNSKIWWIFDHPLPIEPRIRWISVRKRRPNGSYRIPVYVGVAAFLEWKWKRTTRTLSVQDWLFSAREERICKLTVLLSDSFKVLTMKDDPMLSTHGTHLHIFVVSKSAGSTETECRFLGAQTRRTCPIKWRLRNLIQILLFGPFVRHNRHSANIH